MHTLSFPGLGIGEFTVNSTAFSIGSIEIKWYALIITFGIICAVAYTMFRAKAVGITPEDIFDYAIFVVPIGILGARLYYVLTTLGEGRYQNIIDVFNIRDGGLAIYGGIIAGGLTVLVVSKIKKIPFRVLGDCISPGLILAQAIGRWGNFMNAEAYGSETDIFIRMGIGRGDNAIFVHPCFLYESLWNILGFILINIFYKKKKYDGQIMVAVFGWYGLGRMFIEGLRTDSLWVGPFGVVQVIFFAILLGGAGVLLYNLADFIKATKAHTATQKQNIIFYSSAGAALLSLIMIIFDTAFIHSVVIIPEQRVSQVLGCAIFVFCLAVLIYLEVKKYSKPMYYKEKVEKGKKEH